MKGNLLANNILNSTERLPGGTPEDFNNGRCARLDEEQSTSRQVQ